MATDQINAAFLVNLQVDDTLANKAIDDLGVKVETFQTDIDNAIKASFGEISGIFGRCQEVLSDISRTQIKSFSDVQRIVGQMGEFVELTEKVDAYQETEAKFYKEAVKNIEKIQEELKAKNVLHKEENDLVETESSLWDDVAKASENHKNNNRENKVYIDDISRALNQAVNAMIKIDAVSEKFVTSNYRAYGSIEGLAQESRILAGQWNVLHSEVTEAMVVMGNLSVPRHELEGYSKAVAEASRFTGMSIKAIGEHANKMRQVGFSADDMAKRYDQLGEMMRKYKLSTEDASRALNDTSWSPMTAKLILGSKEAVAQVENIKLAWAGVSKAAGNAANVIPDAFKAMEDVNNIGVWEGFSGIKIDSAESYQAVFRNVMKQVAIEYKQIEKLQRDGFDELAQAKLVKLKAWADPFGLNLNDPGAAAAIFEYAKAQNMIIGNVEQMVNVGKQLDDSQTNLTRQWELMKSKLASLVGYALEPARYALTQIAWALNQILPPIVDAIDKFGKWWSEAEKAGDGFSVFLKVVKFSVGLLMVLGMVLATVGFGITTIVAGLGQLKLMTTGLKRISVGLARLGKALIPVSIAAIGFGIALVGAGAGAWLFAKAVVELSKVPYEEVAWYVGVLTVAIVGLAVGIASAIAILGTTSLALSETIPFLAAFAGIMAVLGGAAWLFAKALEVAFKALAYGGPALKTFGEGLELIALNRLWAWSWWNLAHGIGLVATAAYAGSDSFTILGQAFAEMAKVDITKWVQSLAAFERIETTGLKKMVANVRQAAADLAQVAPTFNTIGTAFQSLSTSLAEFSENSEGLVRISENLRVFADSMYKSAAALKEATLSIGWSAIEDMVRFLKSLVSGLTDVTAKFKTSVTDFSKPANELTATLIALVDAIAYMDGAGERLANNLEALIVPLDKYSAQLEAAAERLQTAVETKLLPALKAAEQAGIKDAIKSEALTNVDILPPNEKEDLVQMRIASLLEDQNAILRQLTDVISGFDTDHVAAIKEMLTNKFAEVDTIPKFGSTELNGWS